MGRRGDSAAERKQRPVIFLAFANDHSVDARYLRSLPEEYRRLQEALRPAERAGLCDVVLAPNATLRDIFNVFQDPDYRDRVALFHFAGHAGGYEILLESSTREPEAAFALGLSAFLGQQAALELVFLNGCSTEGHVEGLLNANVSAVIATAADIDDEAAMIFAERFYHALANGAGLRTAFLEAEAAVKASKGSSPRGALSPGSAKAAGAGVLDGVPWRLSIRPGAEAVSAWNLPKAAGDPLFGLPRLPEGDLPDRPFRHLDWFTSEHAEIFFGRGREIRTLYDLIAADGSAPIVLFYGQSGVGKSSLLAAGLAPRLEQGGRVVRYVRRTRESGLLGALTSALPAGAQPDPGGSSGEILRARWRAAEEGGRPLVVILDQVEEIFTRPREGAPDELHELLDAVAEIFVDRSSRPKGKLVLSFRKEWQSEIEHRASERKLFYTKMFVEPLKRQGILEAICGPTRSERLATHFSISIEEGLPELIADDLLEDRGSALAPTLQILLTKLWDHAQLAEDKTGGQRVFTADLYQSLKREGLLLSDFLDQQLEALERSSRDIVDSGLALDLLAFHTTPLGTAEQRVIDEVGDAYRHRRDAVASLLSQFINLYLLVEPQQAQRDSDAKVTRLAHDTLAPLIRQRFAKSDKPGQRARRIVESRIAQGEEGPAEGDKKRDAGGAGGAGGEKREGLSPLDEVDLALVEAGERGTRAWTPTELRLIEISREARAKSQRNLRILRVTGAILLASIIASTIAIYWLWGESRKQEEYAKEQADKARDEAIVAKAQTLSTRSRLLVDQPGHFVQRAAIYAAEAMRRRPSIDADQALRNVLGKMVRPVSALDHKTQDGVSRVRFSPDGRYLASVSSSDTALVIISEAATGREASRFTLSGDQGIRGAHTIQEMSFSADGSTLRVAAHQQAAIWKWQTNEAPRVIRVYSHFIVFSPDDRYVVGVTWGSKERPVKAGAPGASPGPSDNGYIVTVLRSADGEQVAELYADEGYIGAAFNWLQFHPKRPLLAMGDGRGLVSVWDLESSTKKPLREAKVSDSVAGVAWSPDGVLLAVVTGSGALSVFRAEDMKIKLQGSTGKLTTAMDWSGDAELIMAQTQDGTTRVWQVDSGAEVVSRRIGEGARRAAFMGKRLMATHVHGDDVRLWHLGTGEPFARVQLDGEVNDFAVSRDGRFIATAAMDGYARVWEGEVDEPAFRLMHSAEVVSMASARGGSRLVTASRDGKVQIWDASRGELLASHGEEESLYHLSIDAEGERFLSLSGSFHFSLMKVLDRARGGASKVLLQTTRYDSRTSRDDNHVETTLGIGGGALEAMRSEPEIHESVPVLPAEVAQGGPSGGSLGPSSVRRTLRFLERDDAPSSIQDLSDRSGGVLTIAAAAMGREGRVVAAAFTDQVFLWELPAEKLLGRLSQGYEESRMPSPFGKDHIERQLVQVRAMSWSGEDRYLTTLSLGSVLRIWDIKGRAWNEPVALRRGVTEVQPNPGGTALATLKESGGFEILDLPTLAVKKALPTKALPSLCAWSPSGRLLAVGSVEKELNMAALPQPPGMGTGPLRFLLEVWDTETWAVVATIEQDRPINAAAFSPDDKHIVSADELGFARIFELANGHEVSRVVHKGPVKAAFFVADGRLIATLPGRSMYATDQAEHVREVILSRWWPQDLIDAAGAHLSRNLTRAEWRDMFPLEPYRKTFESLPSNENEPDPPPEARPGAP